MRYLGLDIGDRWIGVAVSDPSGSLASPLTIIDRIQDTTELDAIGKIIEKNNIEKIIVGLPVSLNGSLGRQAEKVQEFTSRLRQHTGVPVEFRDERLTTVSAKRLMRDSSKKNKAKTRDDAVAAALILQGFLDEVRND